VSWILIGSGDCRIKSMVVGTMNSHGSAGDFAGDVGIEVFHNSRSSSIELGITIEQKEIFQKVFKQNDKSPHEKTNPHVIVHHVITFIYLPEQMNLLAKGRASPAEHFVVVLRLFQSMTWVEQMIKCGLLRLLSASCFSAAIPQVKDLV
jgi:hypothetical protein